VLDISMAGLIGAIIGTFIAGVNYHLFVGFVEKAIREGAQAKTAEERDGMDARLSLIRRIILTVDIFVFAAIGYYLGKMVWD
jgi:hypothetical protein